MLVKFCPEKISDYFTKSVYERWFLSNGFSFSTTFYVDPNCWHDISCVCVIYSGEKNKKEHYVDKKCFSPVPSRPLKDWM